MVDGDNLRSLIRYLRIVTVTSGLLMVTAIGLMVGLATSEHRYQQKIASYEEVKNERDELIRKEDKRLLSSSDEIDVTLRPSQIHLEVNQQRTQNNQEPLVYSRALERSACAKAKHMIEHDYWDHISPDGLEPWYFIQDQRLEYSRAGENLARGFSDSQEVVDGWMNSRSHRLNLLGDYTHQGICIHKYFQYQGDSYRGAVVVQHLLKP